MKLSLESACEARAVPISNRTGNLLNAHICASQQLCGTLQSPFVQRMTQADPRRPLEQVLEMGLA